ncbi:transglutaminase domain-containing protein [uncultured Ruminococcus sp.]|uniref:transglutaminase domain-containing protein n=1 Tax=uncultured Ruminococcus sp. TaxID=165186 RepID=UPI002633A79C|nr:transglutaminase domain-containing protein [uncultured Ruminococcus sp.]
MKKQKIVAALTAAVLVCTAGCSLGGTGEKNKDRSKNTVVNTHVTYVEGNSEKHTETGLESRTDSFAALEIPDTAEYIADFLSDDEKRVFSQLYKGLSEFESSVELTEGVISKDDIGAFISMLTSACPYIDYIGSQYTICIDGEGFVTSVEVTYDKTAEEAQAEKEKLDEKVGEILAGIEQGWSDYDKVLYFHDRIILGCTYDDTADEPYSAYGCLVDGRAVCEGYAKAMQILCTKAGIKCIPVAGKAYDGGTVQPHLWNKVMIDGEWTNMDLTWDDPVTDAGEDYIRYDYFGITDAECAKDHTADDNKFLNYPEAFSSGANYYRRNGLYAQEGDDISQMMCSSVTEAMTDGSGLARLKCADKEVYSNAEDTLFDENGGIIFDVLRRAYSQAGGDWSTSKYAVIKNDDLYTVTIILYRNE